MKKQMPKKSITFPEAIRMVRGSLSRAEMARRAKISPGTIYGHEKGNFLPTELTYAKLVSAAPGLKAFPKPNLSDATPRGPASDYGGKKNVRLAPSSEQKPKKQDTAKVNFVSDKKDKDILSITKGTKNFDVSVKLLLALTSQNLSVLKNVLQIAKEDKLDLDMLLSLVEMFGK